MLYASVIVVCFWWSMYLLSCCTEKLKSWTTKSICKSSLTILKDRQKPKLKFEHMQLRRKITDCLDKLCRKVKSRSKCDCEHIHYCRWNVYNTGHWRRVQFWHLMTSTSNFDPQTCSLTFQSVTWKFREWVLFFLWNRFFFEKFSGDILSDFCSAFHQPLFSKFNVQNYKLM